jgi:3-deoxy-D-manno-octulosonic-acid transferase
MRISSLSLHTLYTVLFYGLIPFIVARLLWRSIKAPAYRQRWQERFGYYQSAAQHDVIWFHAVSVGETETLFPLIKIIQQKHPNARLLITTTTPTGSARVNAVLKNTVQHVYLPYDIPGAVNRFMRHFKPRIAVIMETEIWPNLFNACAKQAIPLTLINARLSERSTRGYQKIPTLIKPVLAHVHIVSQSQQDTKRFVAIGANRQQLKTVGNMKFDIDTSPDLLAHGAVMKAALFNTRFVWLIASTHHGEEAIFLSIYQEIKQHIPELLLVIVPRHPERFANVKKLCEQQQLKVITRTSKDNVHANTDVYLLDVMGELKRFYATADVAFVGGSMVNIGGHNILEAAAVGIPVMFGPFMANFKAITDNVLHAEAAIQCHNKPALIAAITHLYQDTVYRETLAKKGQAFVANNTGVVTKVYDILATQLTPECSFY